MTGRLPRLLRRRGVIISLLCVLILGMGTVSGVVLFRHAGIAKASTPYDPLANGFGDAHSCLSLAQHDGLNSTLHPDPTVEYPTGWSGYPANLPGNPTFTWTGGAAHGASSVVACDDRPSPSSSFDGYDEPFQCVDLIVRYAYIRWDDNPLPQGYGGPWGGNGAEEWATHPSHFHPYNNGTSTVPPAVGDILVWGDPNNPANTEGHVAIIMTMNGATFTTLEQRFSNNSGPTANDTMTFTNSGGLYTVQNDRLGSDVIYGWLHNTQPNTPTDGHDVYAVGADQHLYDYQSKDDVGKTWITPTEVSSSIALQGSPSSFVKGASHFVFAIATNGDLYEFVKQGPTGSWTITDLTSGVAQGHTFQGSPSAYTFTDIHPSPSISHIGINAVGTDGQLYNLDYRYDGKSIWTLSAATAGPTLSGSPSGYAVTESTGYFQLVYVRSGGQIVEYEYYLSGSTYVWKQLNTFTLNGGVNADGSPSAFTYTGTYNGSTYTEHCVFVIGDNGHLFVLHYVSPLNWQQQDISANASGVTLTRLSIGSSPNADLSTGPTFFVYGTGDDGNLYEFYANDNTQATGQPADTGAWTAANLGVDGALSVTGSPSGYTFTPQSGGGLSHIVYFSESDGNLYAKYYQYPAGWAFAALGHPSGTSMNGSSPNGFYYGG